MQPTIRRAVPTEADILTDICLRSKKSNGYDDVFMAACVEELSISQHDIESGEYWVAELDKICGCACLDANSANKIGTVESLFIDPNYQRRGIGKLLWATLVERAKVFGLHRLVLDADPEAVVFYQGLGLTIIGEKPSQSIRNRMLPHMAYDL